MTRYILKRVILALLTLWLVTAVVFFTTHVLPGNVGLRILGPFAERDAINALNEELGMNRPIITQYLDWIRTTLHGDLGQSILYDEPVSKILWPALVYSAKLASMAFLICVPLSILGGVVAALQRGKLVDRVITVGSLSAAMIPEFVWGVIFVLVFGVELHWLPVSGLADDGAGPLNQALHLLMPSFCLVLVLFGYIARITRAGVIEALDSDYTRTAILKGMSQRQVIWKHVLRNALLPTIAVVASQITYLIGGLVAIELIFNYPGFGSLLLGSVTYRDYPTLQAAVLITGTIIVTVQLLADILFSVLNPRIRQGISS